MRPRTPPHRDNWHDSLSSLIALRPVHPEWLRAHSTAMRRQARHPRQSSFLCPGKCRSTTRSHWPRPAGLPERRCGSPGNCALEDWSLNRSMPPRRATPPAPAPAGWRRSPHAQRPSPRCDNSLLSARLPQVQTLCRIQPFRFAPDGTRLPLPTSPRAAYTLRHLGARSLPIPIQDWSNSARAWFQSG